MARNPVEDNSDSLLVAAIDEMTKLIRVSKAARRRIVTGDLVTPGTIKRMLGDREQFDVGIPHFLDIRDQSIRELDITQIPVVLFRNSRPRPKVHFIDANRLLRPIPGLPFGQPQVITPFEAIEIEDQGGRLHPMLAEEREGIAFQNNFAKAVADLVFVMSAFTNSWHKDFPNSCFNALSHRKAAAVPVV